MKKRIIRVISDINHDSFRLFDEELTQLEAESKHGILLILCSDGGDGQVALAFYDRIRISPCEITVLGTGTIASAASLILIAPRNKKNRLMTKNAWLMVHDDSVGSSMKNERVVHANKKLKQFQRFEEQWNRLFAEATGMSTSNWKYFHEYETYLPAQECVTLNVIGGISK